MNNIWKLIDTNEIILELCWSYLGLCWTLKNYNKIKASCCNVKLITNHLKRNVQNVNTAISHKELRSSQMQQMLIQNIIFLEKKLVVSNTIC